MERGVALADGEGSEAKPDGAFELANQQLDLQFGPLADLEPRNDPDCNLAAKVDMQVEEAPVHFAVVRPQVLAHFGSTLIG